MSFWGSSDSNKKSPANQDEDAFQELDTLRGPKMTHKERLIAFYEEHNPIKLGDEVDEILEMYKGKEEELFANLNQKYGITPAASASQSLTDREKAANEVQDQLKKSRKGDMNLLAYGKLAWKLGMGELSSVKKESAQAVSDVKTKIKEDFTEGQYNTILAANIPAYYSEDQMTLSEIREALSTANLWDNCPEQTVLQQSIDVVDDINHQNGMAEQSLKAWVVKGKGGMVTAAKTSVLVLSSATFYRVTFDRTKMQLQQAEPIPMNLVINIKPLDTGNGQLSMTVVVDKTKTKNKLLEWEESYTIHAPDGTGVDDVHASSAGMVRAFQQVHRRFITPPENIVQIAAGAPPPPPSAAAPAPAADEGGAASPAAAGAVNPFTAAPAAAAPEAAAEAAATPAAPVAPVVNPFVGAE
jgi:hypothetical protein